MDQTVAIHAARPLWANQRQALAKMAGRKAFALLMEMRTGKTATILAEWAEAVAAGELQGLLVVAPAGVYRVWEGQAKEHLPADLLARTTVHTWAAGATAAATQALQAFRGIRTPRVLLVNVEALSTVQRARDLCTEFLEAAPAMAVVDESTCIKGFKAARSKFVVNRLAPLAARRRILSGLPTPQGPFDLYQQFAFLDWRILRETTYRAFCARYGKYAQKPFGPGGRMIPILTGYQDLERLQALIEPHSYRCRLEDCYDLPAKMYSRRDVGMTAEQAKAYAQMKAFAVAALSAEEHVTATMVLTQLLRLHQILCGHVRTDDGNVVDIPDNRVEAVLAILAEHPAPKKAVVWASYDADVRKISEALATEYDSSLVYFDARGHEKRRKPAFPNSVIARFWGGNADTREGEEKEFLTSSACRFMVATPASGGRGRNWSQADLVIYHSNTFNLEHRAQSEERPQAVGKRDSVCYVDLMCPGTVEEKIVSALRKKIDVSTLITGDPWREWLI